MKENHGITMTSLVIYIVGLVIVIGIMATFTGHFYQNVDDVVITQNADEEYSKFLAYLTNDANSENLEFVQSGVNGQTCIILKFKDGQEHQYIYQNNKIYYLSIDEQEEKKIILCSDVSVINVFDYSEEKINIDFNIGNKNFSTSLNVNIGN